MAYATVEELSEYTGIDEADLPDDAERMLDRASELIDRYTLGRIDTDREKHEEIAKAATCAQVEWWEVHDDEYGLMSQFDQVQIGNFQMHKSDGKGLPMLAPRAYYVLVVHGLMYRAVRPR